MLAVPEPAPLEAFGPRASAAVGELLDAHGIAFRGGARPVAADAGELEFDDGERIPADAVIALPALRGRPIEGVPHDGEGFVAIDDHGRVEGLDRVYAAGDMTTFPLKQGGLAAQQADAAVDDILAALGLPIVPRPFEGILRGVLYTDGVAVVPARCEGPSRLVDVVAAEQDRRPSPGPVSDHSRRGAPRAGRAAGRGRPARQHRRPCRGQRFIRRSARLIVDMTSSGHGRLMQASRSRIVLADDHVGRALRAAHGP